MTLASWAAPKRSTPGGQRRYSDLAIALVLTLRLVFHLALRQAEGFTRSVRASGGPVHLVRDSTGWSCSARVSGMRPSTAAPADAG